MGKWDALILLPNWNSVIRKAKTYKLSRISALEMSIFPQELRQGDTKFHTTKFQIRAPNIYNQMGSLLKCKPKH